MRLAARRALRLRLRDFAALSAFSAVAISGSLPLWVMVLFLIAFVISLFGRRPLANQRAWAVIALLAVAIALFGLAFRGLLDLVVAAVSFAALVTAHRLVSEPSSTTDQQVLLASLLLIAGAAALAGEVWFALCLLLFGVFACLHLGLSVVEGPVERDEDLPMAPVLRQVSIGVGIALVGGIAFFVLFPRLSWNVAALRTPPGLLGNTTGMSDRVRLGGGGDLKTSARVVLRARLDPDPGSEQLNQYWIGRRFDVFDGREWKGSGVDQPTTPIVRLADIGSRQIVQRIELLPAYGAKTLVALQHPAMFSQANAQSSNGSFPVSLVQALGEEVRFATDATGYTYQAISMRGTWMRDDDDEKRRALVTDKVDPKVGELVRRVIGTEKNTVKIAQALEKYLKDNYEYSLQLEGEVADPLTEFLFVRKSGHCEHFATALTLMLRSVNVPARVAVGFFGGERMVDRYVVRAGDAHAWVEAWVDEQGWVTFDATPEAGRGGQPPKLLKVLTEAFEKIEELWRSRVVDYSIIDQVKFVRNLVQPPVSELAERPNGHAFDASPKRVVAGLTAALVLWWLLRQLARPRKKVHPAATFLAAVESRLKAAQIPKAESETLEEVSLRLSAAAHPLAPALQRATRRYLEARFGERPISRDEQALLLRELSQRTQQN